MQLIIDRSDSSAKEPLYIIPQQRLLKLALYALAALALVVYLTAYLIATHWATSGAEIVADITRQAVRDENADRRRLWQESIARLENKIAGLDARVIELYAKGAALSNYLKLPGDEMFAVSDKINADADAASTMCFADETLAPEEQQIQANDVLYQQTSQLDDLERKYDSLRRHSVRQNILANTTPITRPILGRNWMSSRFGYRRDPFTGRRAFHTGYDFAAQRGTPIIAAADGIVTYTGKLGNYGKAVRMYHGDKISTLYAHMHTIDVQQWEYVKQGAIIGTVGSTGRSTGPHLHYEVRVDNRPRPINKIIKQLRQQRNLSPVS